MRITCYNELNFNNAERERSEENATINHSKERPQQSAGKLAAQVSHASMAFISTMIRDTAKPMWKYETLPAVMINPETGEKEPRLYRRDDLSSFAKQGRKILLIELWVTTIRQES